jgi:hypothetical protein
MPIMLTRRYPASEPQPEIIYEFELNKEETDRFFNEFLQFFWDQSQMGDLELREKKVSFTMHMFKKQSEEDNADIGTE